ELYDAKGCWLLPGFIDGHTHLGLLEDSMGFEGDDVNEESDPATPHLRAIDAINPLERCFKEAREGGVTCVAAGPGSANPIGGQFAAIKTDGVRIDNMILRDPVAMKFALGENPKSVYHGKNAAPETRMATAAIIRENLMKAKKYAEDKHAAENDEDADEPEFDMKCEALLPLMQKKIPAHFHAHRADDIFTAIRIAKEFDLDYTIVHCTEGYLVKNELAAEQITAFVGPNLSDRSKPELKALSFENPVELDAAGVLIGLTTDHPVIPLPYLPLCASLCVKAGMSREAALRAITINPAKILGIDSRVGSLVVGKDADLVLSSGDPLDMMNSIEAVFIDGKKVK
ncbi:MAG: amidohydrolase, partial [Clostridia bacterium]|nr:amidohydrolase [Clostridia bacterium]